MKLRLTFAAAGLLAVLVLASPGRGAGLVVTDSVPSISLDPFNQIDAVSHRVCIQIFEHLTYLNPSGVIEPNLAVSWTTPAPGVHRFRLRSGVRFHDGRELRAADVVHSLNLARKGRLGSFLRLSEVAEISPLEVEIKSPSPSLLADLAFAGFIVPETRSGQSDPGRPPVGTGPYRFLSRSEAGRVEMALFPDYWAEKRPAAPGHVVFDAENNDQLRRRRLENGQSDVITDINPHLKLSLLRSRGQGIRLYSQDSARVFGLVINSVPYPGKEELRQKLSDPRVRQALNLAVDKRRIIDVILLGNGRPLSSPLASVIPGRCDVSPYAYDPERARALLREAGAENLSLQMAYSPRRAFGTENIMLAVAKYLAQVGLKVGVETIPWAEFLPTLIKKGKSFDLYFWTWGNPILDPAFTLDLLLNKEPFRPWNEPEVADLLRRAAGQRGQERLETFNRLDCFVHQAAPWIFLFQKIDSYATTRRTRLTTAPTELFRAYYDVSLEEEGK